MSKVSILAFDQIAMFELACAVEMSDLPRPEYKKLVPNRRGLFR
jgi:hypothetical protein